MARHHLTSPVTAVRGRAQVFRGVSGLIAGYAAVGGYAVLYLLGVVSEDKLMTRLDCMTFSALLHAGDRELKDMQARGALYPMPSCPDSDAAR